MAKNKSKRRMTAKQIRFFGSPAQKAALRRKRAGSRKSGSHSHRANKGSHHIVGYTVANTGRGKGTMAKTNRKNKKGGSRKSGYKRHSARSNKGATHHRRRHRNPGSLNITEIVTNAVFVIAGALGSKLITQMVLGSNNVGLIGYAGNAVTGGLLWFLTEKVMHNRTAANGVIAGTAVQIILRLINDYTPFGQYVSQLGMGDYQAQSFVTPQVLVDPYNSAQIRIPSAWLPPPPAPAPATTTSSASAAAGVSGYGSSNLYGGRSDLY